MSVNDRETITAVMSAGGKPAPYQEHRHRLRSGEFDTAFVWRFRADLLVEPYVPDHNQ